MLRMGKREEANIEHVSRHDSEGNESSLVGSLSERRN